MTTKCFEEFKTIVDSAQLSVGYSSAITEYAEELLSETVAPLHAQIAQLEQEVERWQTRFLVLLDAANTFAEGKK